MPSKAVLTLVILLLGLLPGLVQSQTVVYVSGAGSAKYKPEQQKRFQKIQPGAVLLAGSTFKYKGKGNASLCNADGAFKQVGKGKHALPSVFAESGKALGFDNMFGMYVIDAINMAKVAEDVNADWAGVTDPKQSGDGWGVTDPKKPADGWGVTDPKKPADGWGVTDPKKPADGWGVTDPKKPADGWGVTDPKKPADGWGVTDPKKPADGWGGQGKRIHGIMPFGKLVATGTRFSWSKPANASGYQLEIWDEEGSVIHSIACRDTFAEVNLSDLKTGSHYVWMVTAVDNKDLHSEKLEFAIAEKAEQAETLQRLERSKLYNGADPVLRGLMECVALEQDEWFYPASLQYAALKSSNPNGNAMIRILYAAFWTRYGLAPMAHAVIRK